MIPARDDARADAMAALLSVEDVEANNTVLVLSRHGWLCREIAPVIDQVEAMVRRQAVIAAGIVPVPMLSARAL